MQLKVIFQVCLVIGTIVLLPSCGKKRIDYLVQGDFNYINATADTIQVLIRGGFNRASANYIVAPSDTLQIHVTGDTHEAYTQPSGYKPGISADTTTLIFRDTLCYSEDHFQGQILHNIHTHTSMRKGDRYYVFYYVIDSTLENLATRCN
jgi:hypothetical protein